MPAACNYKTIHGVEMKFGRILDNQKLIDLVFFIWQLTPILCHYDEITVEILDFYEILLTKKTHILHFRS